MPWYEYECCDCGSTHQAIVMQPEEEKALSCGGCGSMQLTRMISRCAFIRSDKQRVDEFDTQAAALPLRDERHVGLWAQKRMKDLGVLPGTDLGEKIERARSGKWIDGPLI
jgi:putative FmdB family regulatory protein